MSRLYLEKKWRFTGFCDSSWPAYLPRSLPEVIDIFTTTPTQPLRWPVTIPFLSALSKHIGRCARNHLDAELTNSLWTALYCFCSLWTVYVLFLPSDPLHRLLARQFVVQADWQSCLDKLKIKRALWSPEWRSREGEQPTASLQIRLLRQVPTVLNYT